MNKKIIAIILSVLMLLGALPVFSFAGTPGDVNSSGRIDATDARITLRAAVGLEKLTDEQMKLADVDFNGTVNATDARLILRAAVGLEELHKHSFSSEVTKAAGCTEKGEKTFTCSCGDSYTEEIPATGHELVITEEAVAPTCTEDGRTQGGYCKSCDIELISEAVPALGHDFKNISLTSATKCSVPGCEDEMPAFNAMVNVLKSRSGILSFFTGIFEDISHNDETVVSGMLADMADGEDMAASTKIDYAPLTVDRLITNTNFHSKGMEYVSDLTDADVKSISVQKVSTVDFVDALPSSFSSGKFEYDISAIKAYEFPELYKITIVIPEHTADMAKPVEGTFAHDKIYTKNYRNLLEDMRLDVVSGFDSLAKELAGLEGVVNMSNSGKIKTALTVEYFVKTDTFTPVAAKYSHVIDVDFTIKLTGAGLIKIEYLKLNQKMDMTSNAYYFFNNDFGMQ